MAMEMEMGPKRKAEEISVPKRKAEEISATMEAHPYAFHISGPRNLSSPNWRDIINSTWKHENHKRTVMACFIQAAYLLELDKQENRTQETALAPKWWLPFKYKLVQTLIDERDGSIFGAILEWDRISALADFIPIRPSGAPKAVLALRGTLLTSSTIQRDLGDDLRYLIRESLKGSIRFKVAFDALKSFVEKYGSHKVCIAGHSLGAGFALQVGKALAKEGVYVETHLFNPPSVSLAMGLKSFGEKALFVWKRFRGTEIQPMPITDEVVVSSMTSKNKWVPHLYVNDSDYVCCYYTRPAATSGEGNDNAGPTPTNSADVAGAKLFVLSKGKQKFLEAHSLEQWWADELELQTVINNSKLISRQLKSLYQPGNHR